MSRRHKTPRQPESAWLGRLRDSLFYDEEIGAIRWLIDFPELGVQAGDFAGCPDKDGYIAVSFEGSKYFAHRLAFVLKTGLWPAKYVDHIDRCRGNNAWINLRDVSAKVNAQNKAKRGES